MAYSIIVFILSGVQLAIIGGSYLMEAPKIFYAALVYGSPFYLAKTIIGEQSFLYDKNPLYLGILIYHIVKYFFFMKAQRNDDDNKLRTMAVIFEITYLALSTYYLL